MIKNNKKIQLFMAVCVISLTLLWVFLSPDEQHYLIESQNSSVVTASEETNIAGPTNKLVITPKLPNETVTMPKINDDIPTTPNERFQLIFDIYDENNLTLETCARIQSDTNDFMSTDEPKLIS